MFHINIKYPAFFTLFFSIFVFIAEAKKYDPAVLYLTLNGDPTSTMTINWISDQNKSEEVVFYCKVDGNQKWKELKATDIALPHQYPGLLHRVHMKRLEAGTRYQFKIGKNEPIYKFKTLPQSINEPLRFVVGGDVYHDSLNAVIETNKAAASTDPAFALQGGDLGYTSITLEPWIEWLKVWKETMITSQGELIPMIAAVGNHDVESSIGDKASNIAIFSTLFRDSATQSYTNIDFKNYLTIIVLDTGHINPVEGRQTDWLKGILKQREHFRHKFALYHVPAYPSQGEFTLNTSTNIRTHWVPLFEKHKINAAFENHNHCYKRTVLIKNGAESASGVLYLGDGAWGVTHPRRSGNDPAKEWYLLKSERKRHFILVTLTKQNRTFEAIDFAGNRFDFVENAKGL